MNRQPSVFLTALAASSVTIGLASAQPAPPPAPADQSDQLEEITITAERREETAQHAALPISILSASDISAANVTRPEGLTQLVPSLQATDDTGPYSIFYVRGVGNYAANGLSDPALLVNFDGVSVGRSGTSGLFFDLDRVEVLKGPQGTLYGRNATGGAINILSKQPELGQFEIDGSLEWGNYAASREDGVVNIPFGSDAALRIAGYHTQHNGYMSDGTDSQDDSGARISFKILPSDALSINIVADYFHQGGDLSGGTITGVTSAFATPPPFSPSNRYGFFSPQVESYLESQEDLLNGANFQPFQNVNSENNTYTGVEATIDWKTPIGTLTFLPAFRDRQLDYASFATGVLLAEDSEERQTTMELRLASDNTQAFRYVVGAYYMDDPDKVPKYDVNQQANVTFQNYTADTVSDALFANLTYAVTPAFRLNAGARYTQDRKDFDGLSVSNSIVCQQHNMYGLPSCPAAASFPYSDAAPVPPDYIPNAAGTITTISPVPNNESDSYSKVTWRAGANYDLTDENMLYASVETGFKSGGFFFAPAGVLDSYVPETITAYTLGAKNRFLDNTLQANLELFYWDYHNQQISHLDSANFVVYFPTQNIGSSTIKGAELDLQWKAQRNTLLSGDVQYNDAVYDTYVYQVPNQNGGFGNGTGCAGPLSGQTATTYTIDCSGKTPPYAPRWTLSGDAQQTLPLANGAKLVGDANVHYQSTTLTALEFLPVETQGGYAMWNFDLTYSTAGDRLFVGGYVDNAFNKTALAFSFLTPFSQFSTATLQHPRTFGARFGFRVY
jgi:iron complex outermembrane recepter protein